MALTAGTRLGHFEVRAPLGAGGMGEVYRARDLDLHRDVALKVLPDTFAADPQRLARFAREARAAAALNHPNILTVYEVGTGDPPFVASELLIGQTLRGLLGRPLPLARAVDYATQIAEGLAAAHATGIVHRDIKPENLFVTDDGRVKILDFGIATRSIEPQASLAESTLTARGAMLGTPAYMAPEQVRGEPVDARTDIFAFGAVLYEMVTGQRAFGGRTGVDSLSAVLKDDPPGIAESAPGVPPALARVVRRCLAKTPERRFQSATDVAFALELASERAGAGKEVRRWTGRQRTLMLAATLTAALVGGAIAVARLSREPASPIRATITTPASAPLRRGDIYVPFAISPDGSTLAYVTDSPGRMFIRRLDQFASRPLDGTEDAYDPFFSPDSRFIGFWQRGQLKKVPVAGGPPTLICDAVDEMGASWGESGKIVFSPGPGFGLSLVSEAGGTPEVLTTIDAAGGEAHHAFPQFIDGGRSVLFSVTSLRNETPQTIEIVDLATRSRRVVIRGGYHGRLLPTGHLVFARDRSLFAVALTRGSWEPRGEPAVVLPDVHTGPWDESLFSVAGNGTVAYVTQQPPDETVPVWVSRAGVATGIDLPPQPYAGPRVSSDGKRIAIEVMSGHTSDVWMASEGGPLERLTFNRRNMLSWTGVAFSPDGNRLAYAEDGERGARLMLQSIDRSSPPQELLVRSSRMSPSDWLATGETLLLSTLTTMGDGDLMTLRLVPGAAPDTLVEQSGNQFGPTASPDGQFVAYVSDETGRFEVFVVPLRGPGRRRQVTTDGGVEPMWSRDGRELFYRVGNQMMAVPIAMGPSFSPGKSRLLFEGTFSHGSPGQPDYDVTADGRFLMLRPTGTPAPSELRIMTNWFDELRRALP